MFHIWTGSDRYRWVWGVAAVLLVVCCLLGLWVRHSARFTSGRDIFIIASGDDFSALEPAAAVNINELRSLSMVFETLVKPGAKCGEVVPGLAQSWQQSQNGCLWKFVLRSDVCLHDGRKLDAPLAVQAWRRCLGVSGWKNSAYAFPQAMFATRGGNGTLVKRIEAVDARTFEVELSQPLTGFLDIIAHPAMALAFAVPDSADNDYRSGERWIGTGPFQICERRPGERLVLERFERYWRCLPEIRRLVILNCPSALERLRAVQRGTADLGWNVERDTEAVVTPSGLRLLSGAEYGNYWAVVLNCSNHPFNDIRCRLALQYAWDSEQLVAECWGSRGQAVSGLPLPAELSGQSEIQPYPCDKEKARRLLERVVKNGRQSWELLYCTEALTDDIRRLLRLLRQALPNDVVSLQTCAVNSQEFYGRLSRGSYSMALVEVEGLNGDPDLLVRPRWVENHLQSLINVGRFSSSRMVQQLSEASSATDVRMRRQIYDRIMRQLHEEAVEVPVASTEWISVVNERWNHIGFDRYHVFDLSEARYEL